MTLDLDPIRARLAAATPGPWHAYGNTLAAEVGRCTCSPHYGAHERSCGLEDIGQVVERDADLIANAPADMAALIAEVERLRTENEELIERGWADEVFAHSLRGAVQRVRELAETWRARGEHQMAYAETVPEDVRESLLDAGANWIDMARHTLRALDGAE